MTVCDIFAAGQHLNINPDKVILLDVPDSALIQRVTPRVAAPTRSPSPVLRAASLLLSLFCSALCNRVLPILCRVKLLAVTPLCRCVCHSSHVLSGLI